MRKHVLSISLLIIVAICFLPTHGVFADLVTGTQEAWLATTAFSYLIKFASRGWMILAFLAGKLMSNDWIYASGLHLDKVLFTMWNYMKNIANFILGFLLIVWILKSLFTKNAFNFKSELPKFLLASVLINMSWFLMGTLIDLSNVATAAVGAFPEALMWDSLIKDQQLKKLDASIPDKIEINELGDVKTYKWWLQKLDAVRWRFNDMSWPLLFLGSSILRIQDLPDLNQNITSFKSFTSAQIIKIIIVLMFIAPLAALFIINLQRIFYLWLRIIFSPLIILMDDSIIKLGKFDIGKIKEKFTFKEILGMIFAPVLVIWGMSLVLIMSTGMYYVLWGQPGQTASQTQQTFSYGWADIINVAGKSTLSNPQQWSDISFEGDLFRDAASYAWGFVWYIIIVWFTIMLLWAIVKMSISSSKIAEWVYKKVTWLAETIVSSAPIMPVPGTGKSFSLGAAKEMASNSVGNVGRGIEQKFKDYDKTSGIKSTFYNSELGKSFKKNFGIPDEEMRDITLNQADQLKQELWSASNIKALGRTIHRFVQDNPTTSFTTKSREFISAISKSINGEDANSKALRANILSTIGAEEKDAKDILNTNSATWQKFFALLKDMIDVNDTKEIDAIDLTKYKTIAKANSIDAIELHAPKATTPPPANDTPPKSS
jgi:hypothetical protein